MFYYAVAENQTDTINFYAADFDEEFSININAIKSDHSWRNYVLSVVNEIKLLGKEIRGFDCVFGGDIPADRG